MEMIIRETPFTYICPNTPCWDCPYQDTCQDYIDWQDTQEQSKIIDIKDKDNEVSKSKQS